MDALPKGVAAHATSWLPKWCQVSPSMCFFHATLWEVEEWFRVTDMLNFTQLVCFCIALILCCIIYSFLVFLYCGSFSFMVFWEWLCGCTNCSENRSPVQWRLHLYANCSMWDSPTILESVSLHYHPLVYRLSQSFLLLCGLLQEVGPVKEVCPKFLHAVQSLLHYRMFLYQSVSCVLLSVLVQTVDHYIWLS